MFRITVGLVLLGAACANVGDPPTVGPGDKPTYFPNADGARWVYSYQRYLNNVPVGEPYEREETFDGDAVVGGIYCQRFVLYRKGGSQYEVRYLADDDDAEVRCAGREFYDGGVMAGGVYFDPAASVLQYPLRVNRSWSEIKAGGLSPWALGLQEDIDGDGRRDSIDIEVINAVVTKEELTIPIGNFEDCYKVRRTIYATFHMTQGGDVEQDYVQYGWFKAGTGYLQRTGDEITVPNEARYTFLSQLEEYALPAGTGARFR